MYSTSVSIVVITFEISCLINESTLSGYNIRFILVAIVETNPKSFVI